MAELAGKMRSRGANSATPETSPATQTTGGQVFGGQSGGKQQQKNADVPKHRSSQQQPNSEMNVLAAIQAQTNNDKKKSVVVPQPPVHVDSLPSLPSGPSAVGGHVPSTAPTTVTTSGPVPQGRLTEDSIGRMMAEMVKRQLDQRYGA
eukprot:261782_1